MDNVNIKITSKYNNYTIKEFLKANHIGRGRIEEIRVKKSALVNNEVKPLEYVLKENDILTFIIDEKVDFLSDDKKLDIVYEDDYLLIVNKEANMLVHPDSKDKRGTLVNIVANYYNKNNIKRNIRYIHRIDKETTGIVIFAKDFLSEAILINENENFLIEKIYLALVSGYFKEKEGKIDYKIAKKPYSNLMMVDNKFGKDALTFYKEIKRYNDYSLVMFNIKTGRTHQIRVHSSYLNHPLLGDVMYGGNKKLINRVALHSYNVRFIHPILNTKMDIKCKAPNDIKQLCGGYDD
mgnify:FL=1